MSGFQLMVPGKPQGKQRARHGQGRTFTPRETVLAESEIRRAWEGVGSPRVDGPLRVHVTLSVTRPASHYTGRGTLSAEGRRMVHPHKQKPDVDNALKLILDALNTYAWPDDVRIVQGTVVREWGTFPATYVTVEELDGDLELMARMAA